MSVNILHFCAPVLKPDELFRLKRKDNAMRMDEMLKLKKVLISDGALGTELMKLGLAAGECPEVWNIEHPDKVREVAAAYISAGSDIILTNTFGGSRIKLKKYRQDHRLAELNGAGVRLAKDAAEGKDVLVFASLGPTGEFMEPLGDITGEEMEAVFTEQLEALLEAGADGVVFETMMSLEEAACGIRAARKLGVAAAVASLTYNFSDKGFATMMGVTPERAAKELASAGAAMIGANCGMAADMTIELTKAFKRSTDLPLWIKPNAGAAELVNGKTIYRETPEIMARAMKEVVAAGASVIGGCCGTTPESIRAIAQLLKKG